MNVIFGLFYEHTLGFSCSQFFNQKKKVPIIENKKKIMKMERKLCKFVSHQTLHIIPETK